MAILEMNHIYKSFGGKSVLQDVSLCVRRGEIHALLGENGAGKSTLMNILTGVHAADSGEILFEDKRYPSPTIKQMESAGIAFVHQELNVINDLSVSDNIFLGREIRTKLGLIDQKEQLRRTRELFTNLGVEIDPEAMVSRLKTSEKQLLEICRALYADAKLLILDEPTTALSNSEIDHLFEIIRKLKATGKSFIFISHKMPEIFAIADRYSVLRNGEFISSGNISDTTPHAITSDMVGAQFADEELYKARPLGEVTLELEHFTGSGFCDVSLSAHRGEIVALTGLAGCGASELLQAMFGDVPHTGGQILVKGKRVEGSIKTFMKNSVGMLPANRRENSVIPDLSILENFYVAEQQIRKSPWIREREELGRFDKHRQMLHIKVGAPGGGIATLSGGNQQKVFISRWLNIGADILLFDNPTQGVDVGAKEEIYKLILDLAEQGKTIFFNSLEIPEIKKIADRCLVFYDGRIVKSFSNAEINEHDIMLYSTNAITVHKEAEP